MDSNPSRSAAEQPAVALYLFGPARWQRGPGTPQRLDRKSAAVLALAHFQPGLSRASAACWLWPDSPPEVARTNLRVLLFRLARAVGRSLALAGPFLHLPDDVAAVDDDQAQLRAIAASDGMRCPLPLLLEGMETADLPAFAAWLQRTRAGIAGRIRDALRARARMLETGGRLDAAAAIAEWQIDAAPGEEAAWRELMRLQLARGDRAAALAAYERCRRWMSEQLGVDPSSATAALYAQALQPPHAARPHGDDDAASLPELCAQLAHLLAEGGERHQLERQVHRVLLQLPAPELEAATQGRACSLVAHGLYRLGERQDAQAWSDAAIAAARRDTGNPHLAAAIGQRTHLALEMLDLGLAGRLIAERERLARRHPEQLGAIWQRIADVLLAAGHQAAGAAALRHALALLDTPASPDPGTIARRSAIRIRQAQCLLAAGLSTDAEDAIDASLAELDDLSGLRGAELRVAALLELAWLHRIDGRGGRARTALALARAGMPRLATAGLRLQADFLAHAISAADEGAAAQALLEWIGQADASAAQRLDMLRRLTELALRYGWHAVAARALGAAAASRPRGSQAPGRSQEARWLRALQCDAAHHLAFEPIDGGYAQTRPRPAADRRHVEPLAPR